MNALAQQTTPIAANDQDELHAANALGITHKALRAAIKKFGILEPLPDDGQGELFGGAV